MGGDAALGEVERSMGRAGNLRMCARLQSLISLAGRIPDGIVPSYMYSLVNQ